MINELIAVVTEALAEIYSGASEIEGWALIDKLQDRGVTLALDDSMDLTDYNEGLDYHGIDEDREVPDA